MDPKRRYRGVGGSEGSYLVEFTDEEERQRDGEVAKWEAERPMREAEVAKQREEFAKFRESLKYQQRFALFVDVLGWSAAIRSSAAAPDLAAKLGLALDTIRQQARMTEWMQSMEHPWPGDPQIAQFSDCIFASASADHHGREWLVSTLSILSTTLLGQGYFIRGGMTCGLLYHHHSVAFGPAFLRAYELEHTAVYPRVVLEPPLAEQWGQGDTVQDKDGSYIGRIKTWRVAHDGLTFYDFLPPIHRFPGVENSPELIKSTFSHSRKAIEKGLGTDSSDVRIGPKYVWLARYFNEVLAEYPGSEVAPIE